MPRLFEKNPSYRRHKRSGQAVVTLGGKHHYLGPWQSAASKAEYRRLIREWNASGGVLASETEITVVELLAAFKKHAKQYCVDPEGQPTSELATYSTLIVRLQKLYGRTQISEFGPLKLKAFRQSLVDEGLSRGERWPGREGRGALSWPDFGPQPARFPLALSALSPFGRIGLTMWFNSV